MNEYFEACKAYWMRCGDSEGVATTKALWWDCVEVWNADRSWNDEKVKLVKQYRPWYEPYGPVPESSRVAEGNA